MNANRDHVSSLARYLVDNEKIMSGSELADFLNRKGFTTSYGTRYAGGRGIYTLIRQTYYWLEQNGISSEANNVAKAFVNNNGNYAYQ